MPIPQLVERLRSYADALEAGNYHLSGFVAFQAGVPDTNNPFPESPADDSPHALWYSGWQDGWQNEVELTVTE